MDILKVIAKDHREALKIIKKLEPMAKTESKEAIDLAQQLVVEVKTHAKAEEQALYKLCAQSTEKFRDFALEGFNEHQLMDVMLKKLLKTTPGEDGEFAAILTVIKELIEHHGKEEEEQVMFPKLKRAFKEDVREEMGEYMLAQKEKIKAKLEAQLK